MTCFFKFVWKSGAVPKEWKTGVVVPLFRRGDQRVCANYRGITLLSLPGKVYCKVLERRVQQIVEPRTEESNADFVLVVEQPTIFFHSCKDVRRGLGICSTSLHVLCVTREGL